MSHRYCNSSQDSPNGGGNQFDQRFGKVRRNVLVGQRSAQRRRVPRVRDLASRQHTQGFLFHRLAAAAQYRPFAGIDESGKTTLEILIHHLGQSYPRFMPYGSSATTSICTRNPGSTKRCTCTHDVVGKRSLL